MSRLFSIGMIATAVGCAEPNPLAMDDTSSGTTGGSTTMSTTTMSTDATTVTTSTMSTSTMSTTDPTTETTDDMTTTPVDTSTGAPACDASSHRCVAEQPAGWEGPVAIRYSDPAARDPGCAGTYDEPGVVAYADLLEGAHVCDCNCAAPVGVECSDVTLIGDDNANCASQLGSMLVDEDCTAMPLALQIAGTNSWRATAFVNDGQCAAQPTADIGPVSFDDRLTLCGAELAAGECALGEVCAPLPSAEHDGRICVWQLGVADCPDDVWSDRTLLHQSYEDDRACSTCTCGDATGECDGTVALGTTADCVGGQAVASISVDNDCQEGASASTARGASINGVLSPVNPLCTPSDSNASGTIAATGPVTVCCLAPE